MEIPLPEFCKISVDWGDLVIANLGKMFLTKSYYMLQHFRVTAFTDYELLKQKKSLGKGGGR